MEANYCLKCMEKLSGGETVCPHCGYDNQDLEKRCGGPEGKGL